MKKSITFNFQLSTFNFQLSITSLVYAILLGSFSAHAQFPIAVSNSPIGKTIQPFKLRNIDTKFVTINSTKDSVSTFNAPFPTIKGYIVVFTCNHCPFAKLYTQRFNDLNTKFKPLGVPLIAINSMDSVAYDDENYELMQEKAVIDKINFAYLQDGDQTVAKNFGADRTPHAYVIWEEKNQWIIKYSGAIDDNGEHPELATPFIANAVQELLDRKTVSIAETESMGCKIFYRK